MWVGVGVRWCGCVRVLVYLYMHVSVCACVRACMYLPVEWITNKHLPGTRWVGRDC